MTQAEDKNKNYKIRKLFVTADNATGTQRKTQLIFIGNIFRLNNTKHPNLMLIDVVEGKRMRGRPCTTIKDKFVEIITTIMSKISKNISLSKWIGYYQDDK